MASKYDTFFESLPSVQFKECLKVQVAANEEPFLPESSSSLGGSYRTHVDYYTDPGLANATDVPANAVKQGTWAQRYTNLTVMELQARNLTAAELDQT
jgi:N-acetylglucosamine-6-sulfatase